MPYLLSLVAGTQTAQPYQQNHPVPMFSACGSNAHRCCTFTQYKWQSQHTCRLILPNDDTDAPTFFFYSYLKFFFLLLDALLPTNFAIMDGSGTVTNVNVL